MYTVGRRKRTFAIHQFSTVYEEKNNRLDTFFMFVLLLLLRERQQVPNAVPVTPMCFAIVFHRIRRPQIYGGINISCY